MGVSLSLHGVKKIELERTSISVIEDDRIPYEVWNLWIQHGGGYTEGDSKKIENISISIFVEKGKSLKLDSMNTSNLHPDYPPVYGFGIHDEIGSPEDPEDRKILEENPEESDLTSDLTDEELEERIDAIPEEDQIIKEAPHHPECNIEGGCHPDCEKVEG